MDFITARSFGFLKNPKSWLLGGLGLIGIAVAITPALRKDTVLEAEDWGGDPDGPLAKALAKARAKSKEPRKPLKIEKLPHKDQKSLQDYEAENQKLGKTSCCCGADESNPCICMKQPEPMQCSAKEPMCLCYKELAEEKAAEDDDSFQADSTCSWCKKESAKVRDVEYGGGGSICPNCHYAYRKLGYNPHKPQHPFKKSAEHKKMNPIEKPMIAGELHCQNCGIGSHDWPHGMEEITIYNKWGDEGDYAFCGDGCEGQWMRENSMTYDKPEDEDMDAESFGAEATPIRHVGGASNNGYYGIKGYEDASEDGFVYRIYRAPGTNDWFKAMVYDDNSMRDNFRKPTSRRLNPSGQMTISNDPASLLIGAFPKLEDAKRALVFRMIQDGNYHHMITDGNIKWLLKENR